MVRNPDTLREGIREGTEANNTGKPREGIDVKGNMVVTSALSMAWRDRPRTDVNVHRLGTMSRRIRGLAFKGTWARNSSMPYDGIVVK